MIVFKNVQKKQSSAMASAQLDRAQQGQWVWEEQTSGVGTVTRPVAGFRGGCGSERGGKAGSRVDPAMGREGALPAVRTGMKVDGQPLPSQR